MKPLAVALILLSLPLVVLGVSVGQNIHNRETGILWKISISLYNYSQQDFIRGHYITYRYDWNWSKQENAVGNGKDDMLCLNSQNTDNYKDPVVYSIPASKFTDPSQCESFIKGALLQDKKFRIGTSVGNGLQRFYIPEKHAKTVNNLHRRKRNNPTENPEFSITLRVNNKGMAFIENLYIDDISFDDWIKAQ